MPVGCVATSGLYEISFMFFAMPSGNLNWHSDR